MRLRIVEVTDYMRLYLFFMGDALVNGTLKLLEGYVIWFGIF